jgi:hypothetical protein
VPAALGGPKQRVVIAVLLAAARPVTVDALQECRRYFPDEQCPTFEPSDA